jgi:hypothetical protein
MDSPPSSSTSSSGSPLSEAGRKISHRPPNFISIKLINYLTRFEP